MHRSEENGDAHGEDSSARSFDQTASGGYGPASDYFDLTSAMSPEDISNAFRDAIGDETTIRVVELMSRAYMTWMNQERADWLYSYNPMTVELADPPSDGIAAE